MEPFLQIQIVQNAALLVLAALIVYAVLQSERIGQVKLLRQISIGGGFALITFLVVVTPVVMPSGATVDARGGPLVVSAFLGGPLAMVMTAAAGAVARLLVGGSFAIAGTLSFVAYGIAGLIVRRIVLQRTGDLDINIGSTAWMMGLGFSFSIVLMFVTAVIADVPEPFAWLGTDFPPIAGALFLSIGTAAVLTRLAVDAAGRQRTLTRLTKRLELANDAAEIGTWEYDLSTGRVDWDDRMYGLHEMKEFGGTFDDWRAIVHPDDVERASGEAQAAIDGGPRFDSEFRIIAGGKKVRFLRGLATVQRSPNGEPLRMIGVNYDITALRESEDRRLAAERLFAATAENLPGVIFSYALHADGTEQVDYVSAGCHYVWELPQDEIRADVSKIWEQVHPEDLDRMRASVSESARTRRPWSFRWRITTPSGRQKWLLGRGRPMARDDGANVWSTLVLDITQQVATEHELQKGRDRAFQTQKRDMIGKIAAGVSHDFRNLLAVITTNLEELEDRVDGQMVLPIRDSLVAARRGSNLTDAMSSFAHQGEPELETLDLNFVVRDLAKLIERSMPAGVEISFDLADEHEAGLACPVRADRQAVRTLIHSLVLIATDALSETGHLVVETRTGHADPEADDQAKVAELCVRAKGCALRPDKLQQNSETTEAEGPGLTGLGMAMMQGFAAQSGARIDMIEDPEGGVVLSLALPSSDIAEPSQSPPKQRQTKAEIEGARVLLVEDDAMVRRALERTLEAAGFLVVSASDGSDGLIQYRQNGPFDIILTDLMMPGDTQGEDLARIIRADAPDIPVVYLSGRVAETNAAQRGDIPQGIRLMKPVPRDRLLATLKDAMATTIVEATRLH